jgi:ethanolamine ammonia-lyase small subunit
MTGSQVTRDGWDALKQYTSARIALGRAGASLPTAEWLQFRLAHARARDAVHCGFDAVSLAGMIRAMGIEILPVSTQAADRMTYLQRPDLGRRLHEDSKTVLGGKAGVYDLVIIVSDGLSAMAVERHTPCLLQHLVPRLRAKRWKMAPVIVAPFARVALEDEIGALIGAQIALILLGERPGLGAPDSLGAYLVFGPRSGNTDAQRNCVSNIRPEGLDYGAAADTLEYLLTRAEALRLSGVLLKDERRVAAFSPGTDSPAILPNNDPP